MATNNHKEVYELLMDKPIAFHRIFKTITGSTVAALFLSQAYYWSKNKTAISRGGWFIKPAHEWQEETGLTRREQETARRVLAKLGLIEEKKKRWKKHATLHYRLNTDRLFDLIEQAPSLYNSAKLNSLHNSAKLIDCTIPPNYLTETTQRIPPIGEHFKNWKDTPQKYHPLFEAMIEGTGHPAPKGQKTITEWIKQFDDQLERFGEWLTPKRVREAIREFARQKGSTANILRPKSITHILQAAFEKSRKPAIVRERGRYINGEYIHD